jgi:hypothetical protein
MAFAAKLVTCQALVRFPRSLGQIARYRSAMCALRPAARPTASGCWFTTNQARRDYRDWTRPTGCSW